MKSRNILSATTIAAMCVWASVASATTVGVSGYYRANGSNTPITGGTPFVASASGTFGGGPDSISVSATRGNGNVGLHGAASASYVGGYGGSAEAEFDLYTYDTFHIGGPAGAHEQFQYTLTLNGSASTETDGYPGATAAYGALSLTADSYWLEPGAVVPFPASSCYAGSGVDGNPCGIIATASLYPTSPTSQAATGTLTLVGGSTVQFGEYLWARVFTSQATSSSAVFDAADTGYFTLTPLTAGASFTTGSGLTYSASPDGAVPEPEAWAMLILGFGGLGVTMRRLRKPSAPAA